MFLILSRKDVLEPKLTTHITSSTDCSGDSGTHFAPKFVCFKKINPAFQFCNAKVFERCRIAIVIEMSVFFPFCSLCFILILLMLFYCFLHLFCYTFLAYLCHVLLFPCMSSCGFARWRSANKNSTLTFCQTNGAWTTHRSINANNMQHGIHICCSASASWKIATFSIIVWLYFVHWNPCVSSDAVEENGTNLNKGKTGFHVQLFSCASRVVKHFVAPGVLT